LSTKETKVQRKKKKKISKEKGINKGFPIVSQSARVKKITQKFVNKKKTNK